MMIMRSEYFLAIPIVATLINVVFVILVLNLSRVQSQPVLQHHEVNTQCMGSIGEDCSFDLNDLLVIESSTQVDYDHKPMIKNYTNNDMDDDNEPWLRQMPDIDFKAYVRPADMSTYYREPPGSRQEFTPTFTGQACKFVNLSPERVDLYWEGPNDLVYMDAIGPWGAGGTACFPTHSFIFTKPKQPDMVLCRIEIVARVLVYYCDPFLDTSDEWEERDPSRGVQVSGGGRSVDSLSVEDRDSYEAHQFNLEFANMYRSFSGGTEWLTMYPKDPPRHKIWRADYYGQEHYIQSMETHFHSPPPASELHPLTIPEMRGDDNTTTTSHLLPLASYRDPGPLNITIKALSVAPRIFEIRNFLSDPEVDHLLALVQNKTLSRSTTNGHLSYTRTSRTTWLGRESDQVTNAIFRRVADVLRLNEAILREREEGEIPNIPNLHSVSEDLQIVHYEKGQEYTAHHDFGYPKEAFGPHPSRSINLCMYLNDVPAGGRTSFPRWRNGETSSSLEVTPEKGKAVIFYMIMPDGNLDDLTQHAALPVIEGEKYFANLWTWDPFRI